MKHSGVFIALSLQLAMAAGGQSWSEWIAKGDALAAVGRPREAVEAFRRASTAAVPGSNIDERQYVRILNALALLYVDTGQYTEAEQQWRHAAALVEKSEGSGSLDYALFVASMVGLPNYDGNLVEAASVLRSAAASYAKTASRRDLALLRGNLARLLIIERQYGEAEALLQDSLAGLNHGAGGEPELRASLFNALGFIRYEQGRFYESIEMYREEVQSLEAASGSKHFYLVAPLNNWASSLVKLGKAQEAVAVFERAVPLCDQNTGGDQKPCALLFEDYATVLRGLGRKKEAKQMAARGQEMEKNSDRQNGVGLTVNASALVRKQGATQHRAPSPLHDEAGWQ